MTDRLHFVTPRGDADVCASPSCPCRRRGAECADQRHSRHLQDRCAFRASLLPLPFRFAMEAPQVLVAACKVLSLLLCITLSCVVEGPVICTQSCSSLSWCIVFLAFGGRRVGQAGSGVPGAGHPPVRRGRDRRALHAGGLRCPCCFSCFCAVGGSAACPPHPLFLVAAGACIVAAPASVSVLAARLLNLVSPPIHPRSIPFPKCRRTIAAWSWPCSARPRCP